MKKCLLMGLLLFSILPNGFWCAVDCEQVRLPMILGGIGLMVIGNQDRNTDSGKLLQVGGAAMIFSWTF